MSYETHGIARLRVATENTFAEDVTSAAMSMFTNVPAIEGSIEMELVTEMLNPETLQQHLDDVDAYEPGVKSASLAFSMILSSPGAAGDLQTAVQGALGEILAAVMGSETLMVGSTAIAAPAPTKTTFSVATGEASSWTAGNSIMLARGPGNAIIVREIQSVVDEAVTLKLETDATIVAADSINGGASYSLTQDPQGSLQFVVEGAEQEDRWLIKGAQLDKMTLDLPIGGFPRITFGMKGANWAYGGDSTYDLTGSAIGLASITRHNPIRFTGEVIFGTLGDEVLANAVKLPCSELVIEPQFTYQPIPSPSGTQTISRWRRRRVAPAVTGSFVIPYEADTYLDGRAAKTLYFLSVSMGTGAGAMVNISLPTVQIVNVQRIDAEGIAAQRVSFHAQTDGDSTGSTDANESCFRINLM